MAGFVLSRFPPFGFVSDFGFRNSGFPRLSAPALGLPNRQSQL
jgi:hypothetical protein